MFLSECKCNKTKDEDVLFIQERCLQSSEYQHQHSTCSVESFRRTCWSQTSSFIWWTQIKRKKQTNTNLYSSNKHRKELPTFIIFIVCSGPGSGHMTARMFESTPFTSEVNSTFQIGQLASRGGRSIFKIRFSVFYHSKLNLWVLASNKTTTKDVRQGFKAIVINNFHCFIKVLRPNN